MKIKSWRRQLALSLGLLLFAIYLFIYRGGFHSVDEVSIFAVTESLAKFGHFNTNQIAWTQWATSQAEAQGFFGIDGQVYSKKGLALSLVQAPLYWLALIIPGLGMLQTVSLLNAFITAATGLLVFMFSHRMQFSLITSLITALIFGLTTIAAVYAKYLFSEPLAGFLLLLAAYMLFAYRQEGGLRHVAIAGLAAGFAVLTRANNLFLLPVFGLYLLWAENERVTGSKVTESQVARSQVAGSQVVESQKELQPVARTTHHAPRITHYVLRFTFLIKQKSTWQVIITFLVAFAIPGAIMLVYNALRSGNPLQTGYDLTLFSSNIVLGFYKLLFSPLRGLFIYSPILMLSLPGWWLLRKRHPAESWLFLGLVGITVVLFSAWSSGEGLSWGSRFLVPIVPFFAICLAPIVEKGPGVRGQGSADSVAGLQSRRVTELQVTVSQKETHHAPRTTHPDTLNSEPGTLNSHPTSHLPHHALRFTFYVLLVISLIIQILGIAINPWVYLAQIQTEFGGEFFLENTAALYDFSYSQIVGQLQSWSLENSDLAWLRWGFDPVAFGLSLLLVLVAGWLLWRSVISGQWSVVSGQPPAENDVEDSRVAESQSRKMTCNPQSTSHIMHPTLRFTLYVLFPVLITYLLLARYNQTDLQFGPPDDSYSQALNAFAAQAGTDEQIITVAQYHYHVPMNRFKARIPLIGFAQQSRLPETALPLLTGAASQENAWLVTIGFPPASPDNAAERWLSLNTYKISDDWSDDSVRMVRYSTSLPTEDRSIVAIFDKLIQLNGIRVLSPVKPGQSLPVEFNWQALAPPNVDYTTFVQLLNIEGQVVAQTNSPPQGGYAPTSGWQPGEQIISRHALLLPADLPAGDYRLIAGWFNPTTGQRLRTGSGSDFVELDPVTVNY